MDVLAKLGTFAALFIYTCKAPSLSHLQKTGLDPSGPMESTWMYRGPHGCL